MVKMAAESDSDMTFALPDLSGLSEAERLQVIAVMHRAKEFEEQEQTKNRRLNLKMEGQLLKYTNVMKGWQTRWFLLDPESGMLEYFEKEEHKKQRPRGSVHLAAAVVSPSDEDSQTFTVTAANGETFKLRASDAKERQHWVDRLRSTAEYHTANIAQQYSGLHQRKDAAGLYVTKDGTPSRRADLSGGRKSHYSSQESVHSTPGRKQVPAQTQGLPLPFTEVQGFLAEAQDFSQSLSDKIATLPYHGEDCFMTGLDKDLLMLKATSGAALRCVEECLLLLQNGQVLCSPLPQSSSGQLSSKKSLPISASLPADLSQNSVLSSPVESYGSTRSVLQTMQDGSEGAAAINRDEEEEDNDLYSDSELGGVEEHKSIILHLLSQLKLGMDLTKVVLPTFILERRSLLEMFADCMAHPHLFLRIPDIDSPEERMLLVLEWYLTSFHAGRQGSVAKKPYNPIIGETFHCSWRLPSACQEVKDSVSTQSGQAVLGEEDFLQLTYCAEQVSHHPPVSAFYFESPEKKICMNASIWTKSRFMGMSIGVVMVGKVSLRLAEHDEEYVFGLPSAYARSILTVPWVELGDKVSLVCEKTNLSASIIFHTRPFYGGKLHRVSAEVKNNATGAQLCKVSGEWNGVYEFVYPDGRIHTVDTQKLKIWRKRVRPVHKQGELESRRLWQHVTNALNAGDVNTATEHKHLLEERQREGERHRKDSGTVFPTKFFHLEGDTWVYNRMLKVTERMQKVTDCSEDTTG